MKLIFTFFAFALWAFSATLSVDGVVNHKFELNKESFLKLPQTQLKEVDVVCNSGEVKQEPKNVSGVLLMQLLQKANIDIKSKKKLNQVTVLATAMDDYAVAFSYNELFNTDIGNSVIVVYENESFSLYSQKDFLTGPRHVYALENIQVQYIKRAHND